MTKIYHYLITAFTALTGLVSTAAEPAVTLSSAAPEVKADFDLMYDAATSSPSLTMPAGWRVERRMTAPRTLGSYSDASETLMYAGGTSLASNASNGTWNFGDGSNPADRAVGGLTTTVSNGTRCINVMVRLNNADTRAIDRLTLSYDIEKYRNGSNPAGFAVQLYYSPDGETWTSAGDDFRTYFAPDGETLGASVVPISVTPVDGHNLLTSVEAGKDLYLAWNISVATGTSPNLAPGLALDNVTIKAVYADDVERSHIYVEDVTSWPTLRIHEVGGAFGDFPGLESIGSTIVNGVTYKTFEHSAKGDMSLCFNNGMSHDGLMADADISGDVYFCVTPEEATLIADPATYTGWIDPDAPVFHPSGIYLRGDVTDSWSALDAWEFSDEGNGVYVLYDKTLNGAFKVADASWSSSCNYGSSGSNIMMDAPYRLVAGTDDNISCGSNNFKCRKITLTIADGEATLLLTSDDSTDGLTTLYLIGDHNGWNYMDASGALTLDNADNLFKGRLTMRAGADGFSKWRIYQGLGMSCSWGVEGDADQSGDNVAGKLVQRSTASASVAPGTYDVTFNLATGEYSFTRVVSEAVSMKLTPSEVVLVPELPASVKVLSLNNSLIYYNDQDAVFNDIARAMGKDASWTKHTLLGKSLATHWNEGDGLAADDTPSAKMLVRSEAWSHIILQEQSSLPRTDVETFRASVKQWIAYIREYCPNPNAVIILPMNWAYSGDWGNYTAYNAIFNANYADVARELGVVVCPVADAYQDIYETGGESEVSSLYLDDRHPSLKATYMAACMEYSLIFGDDAASISYTPSAMTAAEGEDMRSYASGAMRGFVNCVDHNAGLVRYSVTLYDDFGLPMETPSDAVLTVDGGGAITHDGVFTATGDLGSYTVSASAAGFTSEGRVTVARPETVVITYPAIILDEETLSATESFDSMGQDAEAVLPEAWRIDRQTAAPRTLGTYATALETTMYAGGVNLPSNAKNGLWNFGDDNSDDRAVGGITTGVANGTRAVNVYTHLYNAGRKNIENLVVSYDIEKYRKGKNAAGFAVQLYWSVDGRNWTSAGDKFYTFLEPDDATAGYAQVPGESMTVSDELGMTLGRGCDLYLAWNISVASGPDAQAAMALAIDNFAISGSLPEIPDAKHYIYVEDNTGWDSLGLYAWGDGELYGAWPGQSVVGERDIDGVLHKVFTLDAESGSYNLIFNNWNNGKQLNDHTIQADRDYHFVIDADGVREKVTSVIDSVTENSSELRFDGDTVTIDGAAGITLYTTAGQLVATTRGDRLSLSPLPKGIYIIKAMTPTPLVTKIAR
ncbi:MAG: hypothetical protein NC117_10165 [Pseudoflavonifractor sp.]|nr:hypothetical protein [Pseudoflavonifractor sp.]